MLFLGGLELPQQLVEDAVMARNQQVIPWDLLKKGQEVLLTGKLTPNTWTDKNGTEHQDIEIVVNKIRDLAEE